MRYLCLLFFFFIIPDTSKGQNLVPNPGFEDYNLCGDPDVGCNIVNGIGCKSSCCAAALPERVNLINGATHNWWSVHLLASPFYFNDCIYKTFKELHPSILGHWYVPRTGKAFIIISTFGLRDADTTNYRQYAQVRLIDSLHAGCVYEVSCYALLTKKSDNFYLGFFNDPAPPVPSDGIDLYLSKDSLHVEDYRLKYQALTDYTPQITAERLLTDSVNYQKVSGLFQAQGGEQWLVIGNFRDNQHTQIASDFLHSQSFYSIDDVSVQLWRPDLITFSDTTICTDSSITLTLPESLSDYVWSTGATSRQITLSAGGTYTVQASNGCEVLTDQFTIHTRARYTATFDIGKDTLFCTAPVTLTLTAPAGFNKYSWSNGSALDHITATATGKYKVTAAYECGSLSDSLTISLFLHPDTLLIPAQDTSICSNGSLDLQIYHPSDYDSFVWSDGSTGDYLKINEPGHYKVITKTNTGCEVKDSIAVHWIYPPLIQNFPDTIVCQDIPLNLTVDTFAGESIKWFDGNTNRSYSFHTSGTYWVSLMNACYTSTDTMNISLIDCSLNIPNLITSNQDGMNDYFIIETNIQRPLDLTVYNSWGIEIFKQENYKGQWGVDIKDGIYFYQLTDSLLNKNYKGWVQVVH
jgi:hypothetical protein